MKRLGDLTNPRIAAIYADVPPDRLEEFQAFRRAFPYRELPLGDPTWSYLMGGQGETPALLLSGALALPDISWVTIAGIAARHRVIAPAYPPVKTMDALVDGIAAILRHEGVEWVDVMGGSYGGYVAQVFVRRYPEMTRSLVLSHTQPPYPEMAPRMRRFALLLRLMPMDMVRSTMRRLFASMMPDRSDETACLLAIFDELISDALDKQDILGILARTADFSTRRFTPRDLAGWPGKVLLAFGEDDPATPPDVRERLTALYPECRVHLFEGAGHATSVTHQEAYLTLLDEFLAEQA